jgi:hypothetical protein
MVLMWQAQPVLEKLRLDYGAVARPVGLAWPARFVLPVLDMHSLSRLARFLQVLFSE